MCTSVTRGEDRGGEFLLLYMEKEKAKKDALKGDGRAFLFMIVSILPISLFRRNNQGVI